jgi:dipeptidyl-peptidase-4
VLLTPEPADHQVSIAGKGGCLVDVYGTIDSPSRCVLRNADTGALRAVLIESDWDAYLEAGWHWPLTITVPSRDGRTPIYGAVWLPRHFDPAACYPLVVYVYGFPQTIATPKQSALDSRQELADIGCVVAVVDGLGTAFRSKAFHDASYGNLADATVPDQLALVAELGRRFSWIDIGRVGIYGYSGGAYATLAAMCRHPETFKVGVAVAGVYDHRDSITYIMEKYQGRRSPDNSTDLLSELGSLGGQLLVVFGAADENVNATGSMRLVDALIGQDLAFDMLVVPDADHFVGSHPYVNRRLLQHFDQHLIRTRASGAILERPL